MTKRFQVPADYWDIGLLEQWLEEKAAKGWMPVDFRGYASGKFERTEPQTLRFRLEPDEGETHDQKQEREALYTELGWQKRAVLGDYRVLCCADPTAPELHTDPATQNWAWDKQLRATRRRYVIALVLLAAWTVWQFRNLWEKNNPVEMALYGMWAVWLFVLYWAGGELLRNLRVLRGIRSIRQKLAAGIPLDHSGDVAASLRRRKRQEIVSWTMIALLWGFVLSVMLGGERMDMEDAPVERPWVAMETIDPATAGLELDWNRYTEQRTLLVPFSCEARQQKWDFGPALNAGFNRTLLPAFAEALYRERLNNYMENYPHREVEYLNDARFDGAALITGVRDNGVNLQVFAAWRGRCVLWQSIAMEGDLRDHIDEFAKILEDWQ